MAREFAEVVLRPIVEAYDEAQRRYGRGAPQTAHQMRVGMLACWRMILLLAKERGERVDATFKSEALQCLQLHVVRSWALAESEVRYPRWVKSRPQPDAPIDMGYCFAISAKHLLAAAI